MHILGLFCNQRSICSDFNPYPAGMESKPLTHPCCLTWFSIHCCQLADHLKGLTLIALNMIMDSSKIGRWIFLFFFRKFSRFIVN